MLSTISSLLFVLSIWTCLVNDLSRPIVILSTIGCAKKSQYYAMNVAQPCKLSRSLPIKTRSKEAPSFPPFFLPHHDLFCFPDLPPEIACIMCSGS
ncbi:hypothetical protein C8J56DRAFT_980588 [Mycena floridula]|nr:hypothetical protein C8J56DRAFT_980588 [Mycena floridula]